MIELRLQTFFIGIFITLIVGLLFSLSFEMLQLLIPSLLFSGIAGGVFVGLKRKRPMTSCMYDGGIMGLPASIILGLALVPMFWFYHDAQSLNFGFWRFFFLVFSGSVLLAGIAGAPLGGLLVGVYYRYLKQDRGEGELYETYLEDKTDDSKKKSAAELLGDLDS